MRATVQAPADSPEYLEGRPGSRHACRRTRLLALLIPAIFALPAKAVETSVADIIDTPFEQLLQTEVITAEKLAKQVSGAPSAVSIVTAQDIRDFGYRTLSDILDSMRGLSMSHDHEYGFLAGRGYANASSYAGRITLLIDGYRASDNLWGQTFFGNDGLLDVELIERVEYIPGSGSSSYGDAAFLGVINIITRKGQDLAGTQVSVGLGSHDLYRERVAFGQKFENGLDLLLSASTLSQGGRYLSADFGDSSTLKYEKEKNLRYFLKASYGGWTLESAWAERTQNDPDVPSAHLGDKNTFSSLRYNHELSTGLNSSTHLYFGRYRYQYYQDNGWRDTNQGGNWWGLDSKLVSTRFDRHTIILGAEYRDDYRQSQWTQDSPLDPVDDPHKQRQTWSLYAYDDFRLTPNLQLNFGARVDARNNGSTPFSPRFAAIYTPLNGTTLKLSTGIAHQQPTANTELNNGSPAVERLHTYELVWEQSLGPKTRLTSSLYSYRINNYDTSYFDFSSPDYNNWAWVQVYDGRISTQGAEFELEHLWDNGVRLRASYARQDAKISSNLVMLNLARNNAKLNISAPLAGEWLRAGLAVRYLGRRPNHIDDYDPATVIADLTLTGRWNHWFSSFSIRNLGNAPTYEMGANYYGSASSSYGGDRRNFWFQLGYEFK
ncbi:MAG: TonB-dependent receptor [Azonexus sp.]